MTRFLTLLAVSLPAFPATVLAHPGHVAEAGFGHSHWLALAIFGGLAAAGAVCFMRRRRGARRAAARTR